MIVENLYNLFQKNICFCYSYIFFLITSKIKSKHLDNFLISNYTLDSNIILKNIQSTNIITVLKNQKLEETVMREMIDQQHLKTDIEFLTLIRTQRLSDSFLEDYQHKLNWSWISCYQILSEDSIRKFKDHLKWEFISYKQLLSIDFILEFSDYIDWFTIMKNPFLRLDFIPRCQQYLDWNSVSLFMTINKPLLKKYQERLNWKLISSERVLSEDIIIEFEEDINFELFLKNEKQHQVYKYYSEKIIDIVQPHLDNYKIYHKHASLIQKAWTDFKENNYLINPKIKK